jgi:hypothetical protein
MAYVRTGQYIIISIVTLMSIACSPRPRPHVPVPAGSVVSGRDSVNSSESPQGSCVVQLIEPTSKAVLKQIRRSNGTIEIIWEFRWRDCPEARRYHLQVMRPQAPDPLINDDNLPHAEYLYRSSPPGNGVTNRKGWTWTVRAYVDGRWGNWSEPRTFDVAPPSEPRRVRYKGGAGSP